MQRRFRLRDSRDFDRLKREGRTFSNRGLALSVMPNGLDCNRYGFVAGKRLGNAVARNRVKRRLREAVRELHPRLKPGWDMVFVARTALVGESFAAIRLIVEALVHQARLVDEQKGAE